MSSNCIIQAHLFLLIFIKFGGHRINNRREFFEIAPSEYFDKYESSDYDISSCYLNTLIEIIENGFNYIDIFFISIDINKLYRLFLEQGNLSLE